MTRFDFIIGLLGGALLPQGERPVSFRDLPSDGKPHLLINDPPVTGLKRWGIIWPLLDTSEKSFFVKDGIKIEGPGRIGIHPIRQVYSDGTFHRFLMLYMDVLPKTEESKVGSIVYRYADVIPLLTKLEDVLRIGRNIISSGDYSKTVEITPLTGLSDTLKISVYGSYRSDIDEEVREIQSTTGKRVEPHVFISFENATGQVQVSDIRLDDIHKLIEPLKKAKFWLDETSSTTEKK